MTRFSLFQVVSAYTNSGMSLVDQSMIPFQKAYLMIVFMIFLILAGNTAFVSLSVNLFRTHFPYLFSLSADFVRNKSCFITSMLTRFFAKACVSWCEYLHGLSASTFSNHCPSSWCISKIVRKTSRLHETLQFLLAHPRRCFVYLFPSHQTWFLLTIVLGLTWVVYFPFALLDDKPDYFLYRLTDWFFFLVLDIGNPVLDQIPTGVRVIDGLIQATCVRAAGFATVPLLALAPAVKFVCIFPWYMAAKFFL